MSSYGCAIFPELVLTFPQRVRDRMAAMLQTTNSNAFYWKKTYEFWVIFYWSFFLSVQLTIFKGSDNSLARPGDKSSSEPIKFRLPTHIHSVCVTRPQWVIHTITCSRVWGLCFTFVTAVLYEVFPESKVHGDNMGPIWGRQGQDGPYVGPMSFALWVVLYWTISWKKHIICSQCW